MVSLKSQDKKIDRVILFLAIGLTLFGILMVYNASVAIAFRNFDDKYFFVRQQALWGFIGLVACFFASKFPYQKLRKIITPLMLLTILSLALVLIPGVGTQALGARRWLVLGGLNFQPAELAKLVSIIFIAAFLAKKGRKINLWLLMIILVGLILIEPDLGTAVILAGTSLSLYFVSGGSLITLFIAGILGLAAGVGLILFSPYRRERLLTFFDLSRDPLGASYHVRQVLLALGSGGLFGLGIGGSRQKYEYLPEAMTDSIFAIIGEELGFIGATLLIIAFLVLIFRGIEVARKAPDAFGQLLAAGITAWIAIQTLINLAAMVAIVPLTGVPLPFLSYGGSSLIITLTGVGILLNISKYQLAKK
jgi:cell division protein FtsW